MRWVSSVDLLTRVALLYTSDTLVLIHWVPVDSLLWDLNAHYSFNVASSATCYRPFQTIRVAALVWKRLLPSRNPSLSPTMIEGVVEQMRRR